MAGRDSQQTQLRRQVRQWRHGLYRDDGATIPAVLPAIPEAV